MLARKLRRNKAPTSLKNGRGRMIRTPDPLVPNQVLYQAELCPDIQTRHLNRLLALAKLVFGVVSAHV